MVDFGGAVEIAWQELLKQVERIVKLFENADNEEILLHIVHGFLESLLQC